MQAEQPYELFWDLTFYEIGLVLEGVNRRLIQEHNDRAWMAWHIAAMGRAKTLPRLNKLTADKPRPSGGQTWEEQMAIMKSLSARVNRAPKARRGQTAGEAAQD